MSITNVTSRFLSFIIANKVTEPGVTPKALFRTSGLPKERRLHPRMWCSLLTLIFVSLTAHTKKSCPFLSFKKRFLVFAPAIFFFSKALSSTLKIGSCSIVLYCILSSFKYRNKLLRVMDINTSLNTF